MEKLNKRILFYTIMVTLIYLVLPPLHSLADAHYPKEPKTQLTSTFTRTGTVQDAWVISSLHIHREQQYDRSYKVLDCYEDDEDHEHDEDCYRIVHVYKWVEVSRSSSVRFDTWKGHVG